MLTLQGDPGQTYAEYHSELLAEFNTTCAFIIAKADNPTALKNLRRVILPVIFGAPSDEAICQQLRIAIKQLRPFL
jgi:hypothetical protein